MGIIYSLYKSTIKSYFISRKIRIMTIISVDDLLWNHLDNSKKPVAPENISRQMLKITKKNNGILLYKCSRNFIGLPNIILDRVLP